MKFIDLDYLEEDFKKLSREEQKKLYPVVLTFQAPCHSKLTIKQRGQGWYYEIDRPYKRKDVLVGYCKKALEEK